MGGTLLLADDGITIQKVVELTFAETDHTLVAFGSGRELLQVTTDLVYGIERKTAAVYSPRQIQRARPMAGR